MVVVLVVFRRHGSRHICGEVGKLFFMPLFHHFHHTHRVAPSTECLPRSTAHPITPHIPSPRHCFSAVGMLPLPLPLTSPLHLERGREERELGEFIITTMQKAVQLLCMAFVCVCGSAVVQAAVCVMPCMQ